MDRYEKLEELLSWLNLCTDIKEVIDFYMDDDDNLEAMPESSFEELLECWDEAEAMVLGWLDELNNDEILEEDFEDLDDELDFELEWEFDEREWEEDFSSTERMYIRKCLVDMRRKAVFEAALDEAFEKVGL